LLDECVRFGMAKIAEAAKVDKNSVQTSSYQTEGASGSQHQDKGKIAMLACCFWYGWFRFEHTK
jgi:hypothetical protein